MPKTKFQEVTYGLLMTFFMVVAMELYNTGLRMNGLTNEGILNAFQEIYLIYPVCFIMGFFFIDRIAPKIALHFFTPGEDKPVFIMLARASITVSFMCPIMSFWATIIFKHPGREFIPIWLQTFVCNFPMAFFWQIFFCGPLVRWIFHCIFERGRHKNSDSVES